MRGDERPGGFTTNESYFAHSRHRRSGHAWGQSPGRGRDTETRLGTVPKASRNQTRSGTVPRRGRNGPTASRGTAGGLSPKTWRNQTQWGQFPNVAIRPRPAETRPGDCPHDMSRCGMSEGVVYETQPGHSWL